jgi:hypothetical protein
MQSMGVFSLNHDLMGTASQGAKTLCIHPTWMWDAVDGGLQPQP